ncbi:hypothetical protein NEF87_000054 [Candidatus Lokiarchaeum ossiferum]|uniref:GTP-binding protein n=1 Tax=Candidatus Lokiarchaeum ossiferum TaxID=2951803 RepID=A0ABY6HMQ1_9ARCH|nr:hypothetical protein NEF87_000054 [Candidatus Lokiarchaeum sp. B-35]
MYKFVKEELNKIIEDELNSVQKIAILGLANAGKTSLVKTILYEFEALMVLAPTKGVDRSDISFLGRQLVIWDFGGQERYRNNYLRQPQKYFRGIKYLYYIIDVQESAKIRQSMAYFLKSLEIAYQFNPNLKIYLFFHKYDTKYEDKSRLIRNEQEFIQGTLPTIQSLDITPSIFHTSIYNPFSIISSFAQPLLRNPNLYETLCRTIKAFCLDNQLNFGILFVNDFEIGNYYASPEALKKINQSLIQIYQKIYIEGSLQGNYAKTTESLQINTTKFDISVGSAKFSFYFTVGIDLTKSLSERERLSEIIEIFTDKLKLILRNSEIIRLGVLRTEDIK